MKKSLVRNFAAPVKCRTQNSTEQVRFSKLCIAGLHLSSLFANKRPEVHIECLRKEVLERNCVTSFCHTPL